ncbi:HAD family hydrolase [Enterococcus raffinosus]|uniref:HAD hydrolase, family IA n=1 Tax=Enterococcus raffinosus ATCC 49464 TaxID=1158602 RepID=R2QU09_9ENTE|nr:HAD family phosphatase [Enterococcus raffinosus]EOH74965.1 HAD hydrolase, family IA [Enterococcus raffinosus ATCC 49464]EOT82144.1 hypothetical protein I590_00569 [Enterococcus raffinosus ATCC 49464]OJG84652.1 HAD hydrolase, family IA [Enterococcus raffinosus]UXK04608.1 HAD family phosphatase [Enterococcus raffinosus]
MEETTVKAVIFDMDGVLLNTEPISKKALEQAFKSVKKFLDEQIYQEILGRVLSDISYFLSDKFTDIKVGEQIIQERDRFFSNYYQENHVEVFPGVCSFLEYLTKRKYKLAVATLASKETAEFLLKKTNIFHYFDAFSFGSDVVNAKPNPEIFLNAAEKLEIKSTSAYIVEDAVSGLVGAISGGFIPVYIPEKEVDQEYSLIHSWC